MLIEGYGIRLMRLTKEDIELVRQWRNSQLIKQFMEFREEITSKQQTEWFNSINNIYNNYFIIEVKGEKIGLINGSQIDWELKETKSGGIFIWNEMYWETKTPLASALLLTDTSVILGLEKTYAKILNDNKKAIAFNKALGYKLLSNQENRYGQLYVLEMKDYVSKRNQLQQLFFKDIKNFNIKITIDNNENSIHQFYLKKLNEIEGELKEDFELIVQ
jgi:UDP-4-amino-4,6-dideoxy-N-acetyl-beta-L-altrosamine N-acetyltransferase